MQAQLWLQGEQAREQMRLAYERIINNLNAPTFDSRHLSFKTRDAVPASASEGGSN